VCGDEELPRLGLSDSGENLPCQPGTIIDEKQDRGFQQRASPVWLQSALIILGGQGCFPERIDATLNPTQCAQDTPSIRQHHPNNDWVPTTARFRYPTPTRNRSRATPVKKHHKAIKHAFDSIQPALGRLKTSMGRCVHRKHFCRSLSKNWRA